MSANDLINFLGLKQFQNDRLAAILNLVIFTQEMQNDWTINIKQNVMSHTRITHDKLHTKKSKMAASWPFFFLGNLA